MKTYRDFVLEVQKNMGDKYMISALTVREKAAMIYARYCCEEILKKAASEQSHNEVKHRILSTKINLL